MLSIVRQIRLIRTPSHFSTSADKRKLTCLERYQVEHPMQNPQILSKAILNSSKTKLYTFPSGRQVQVQGYEPFCLDLLIKRGIPEHDIQVGCEHVPSISYIKENGRNGVYFPDIWLPKMNSLIEVKSPWSWLIRLQRNQLKLHAATKARFNMYLYVFNRDGSVNTVQFYPSVKD